MTLLTLSEEAPIRSFGVGLLALATIAVAGFVLRRRRAYVAPARGRRDSRFDDWYAAGL
jgi:hypothetical protein